jgi:hypothetical protein
MALRILISVLSLLLVAGCQYPLEFSSENEIRQEVLAQDSSFGNILKKKAELDENIAGLKSDLSGKENEARSKILILKRELSLEKEKTSTRIKELNKRFDPYRIEMKQKIMEFSAELKLREASFTATNRMISKLKKLVEQNSESKDMAEEVSKWQEKIARQSDIAESLKENVSHLRKKIRLVRLKLKLIR